MKDLRKLNIRIKEYLEIQSDEGKMKENVDENGCCGLKRYFANESNDK